MQRRYFSEVVRTKVGSATRDEAAAALLQSDDPRLATAYRVAPPVLVFLPKSQADR